MILMMVADWPQRPALTRHQLDSFCVSAESQLMEDYVQILQTEEEGEDF